MNQKGVRRRLGGARRIGSGHPIEHLESLFGPAFLEVGRDKQSGDRSERVEGEFVVLEAGKEGHRLGHIGFGGEAIDENAQREGFQRWVRQERCVHETDGGWELVGGT